MTTIRYSEVFGPTIQGEGPLSGARCFFIRLSGCNLDCSWCDTPFTWDWERYDRNQEEKTAANASELFAQLDALGIQHGDLVVVSGGEPMLQPAAIRAFIARAGDIGLSIQIETNGTKPLLPEIEGVLYVVSPKLGGAGVSDIRAKIAARVDYHSLKHRDDVHFKYVITNDDDLVEVDALVEAHDLDPTSISLMPEGVTRTAIERRYPGLAAEAIDRRMNVSSRLHVLLWGDERGR